MSPICPECGTELEIANGYELVRAESAPSGRDWRLLALAVLLIVGACVIMYFMMR